jgi:hypothetical protein
MPARRAMKDIDGEPILRPRLITPLEDFVAAVRRVVPDIPSRMHISEPGTVREWIMASDVTVSSHSTSLIEAAVARKPAFMHTRQEIRQRVARWGAILAEPR